MPGKPVRGSESGAPLMALLDLLGRSWALGVLWKLCDEGPATFRELQARCETVSPTVLNARLKELRQAKLVSRTDDGYGATDLGQQLFAKLAPLKGWSHDWAKNLQPGSR